MNGNPEHGSPAAAKHTIPTAGARIHEIDSPLISQFRSFIHSKSAGLGCGFIAAVGLVFFSVVVIRAVNSSVRYARGQNALAGAHRLSNAGQFTDAIPRLTAALSAGLNNRDLARAYGQRGWAYTQLGRDDAAISDFTAALQLDPNLGFAVLDRGLAFHRQGKFDEAMADYDRAVWLDRNEVDAYRNRALILAHLGRLKDAIADMSEAIRCAPNDPRWFVRRAQLHLQERDLDSALASFDSAIRIDPENVDANYGRAQVLTLSGGPQHALADLSASIGRHPTSARLFFARALVYQDAEELDKAVDDCAEAIRLERTFSGPYAVRASLELQFGALEPALAFANLALELDPKMPLPHHVRGRVLDARRECAEAMIEFDRAIASDSEYIPPVVWHALTQAHAGYYDVAARELASAATRFPAYATPHLMWAWFLATCPESEFRDGPKAVAEAQLAVERSHGAAYALDVLATAHAEIGDFARAQELEAEALDKTPARSGDCLRMEARLQTFQHHVPYRDF